VLTRNEQESGSSPLVGSLGIGIEGIKAGAQGKLLKDSEPEDLARAIRTVHAGDTTIAPELAQKMLNTFNRR
jgi:DNA-binding NarL/FixJ family response regulator